MTPSEIHEASRLLSSLINLRSDVAELDFPDDQITARGMTIELIIAGRRPQSSGHEYPKDLLKISRGQDPEITAAILRIVRRRRREKLSAALRRLEQLGVREST